MTFPLRFKIYQPRKPLKPDDIYQSKTELGKSMIKAFKDFGFRFNLVLSDSLDGESHSSINHPTIHLLLRNQTGVDDVGFLVASSWFF